MDAEFWLKRWEANETAFHQSVANPLLVEHFPALQLGKGARLFVPLCGRTRDIAWLLARGHEVAGAELSELAIGQLFEDLGVAPRIDDLGSLKRYSATGVTIFAGDIFALSRDMLGPVDAVFDRAALVALPEEMRARYARHLVDLTAGAPQLLISYEYDQALSHGPPFSVVPEEVLRLYDGRFEVRSLALVEVEGGLRGTVPAREHVWLLARPTGPASER